MLEQLIQGFLEFRNVAENAFVEAWRLPLETSLSATFIIIGSTLAAYLILWSALDLLTPIFQLHKKPQNFGIKVGSKAGADTVYMNSTTRRKIFGNDKPDAAKFKGAAKTHRADLALRQTTTLADENIEMDLAFFKKLFPDEPPPEGEGEILSKPVTIKSFPTDGLIGYWCAPDRRQRFQNRAAVYFAVFLLILQIVIDFGFQT